MNAFIITQWDAVHENSESRKKVNLRWVSVPNKHDGLSFKKLVARKDKCELLSAWILMLQVSSKSKREERGTLIRDGKALSADDLALMTGFPATIFQKAFDFFSAKDVGWLTHCSAKQVGESPGSLGESPGSLVLDRIGVEGNGEYRNGGDARGEAPPGATNSPNDPPDPKTKSKRFEKPSIDEVVAYCIELGLKESDAEAWYDGKEANGWKNGQSKMVDWRAAVRSWNRGGYFPSQKQAQGGNGQPQRRKTEFELHTERLREEGRRQGYDV